ncbi:MAG TPA: iron-siderophore ABC transporter substrate-binding protein [Aquihabitans sp.]|jgi:iron complex transport system substrate-binding protein|nr:iron-siderophore ABC transporter substrate-binding protein [Aquihabitans sp.]
MTRRPTTASAVTLLVALLAGLLAACGTTSEADGAERRPERGEEAASTSTSEGCEDDATPTATGPVRLTDHVGRTVELDAPAQRVAVLEWQQLEDVLTLCLTPVAVADAEGYSTWVSAEELPEGVADVGGRSEPNLDAVFAAEPDLVIVEATGADDEIIGQLEGFGVPVLATRGADAADPVQHMLDLFTLIAEATGRTARAEEVVAEFEASLADAQAAVADAVLPSTDFVYLDGYLEGGNVALRPFGQGSLVGELGEELGLTNAWTGEVDAAYGLGQSDIEGMAAVGDATFFHTGTDDPEADDVFAALEQNPIWSSLPAVAEDRVHAFPTGIWTFGGPRSSQQVLDAYVDLLTD